MWFLVPCSCLAGGIHSLLPVPPYVVKGVHPGDRDKNFPNRNTLPHHVHDFLCKSVFCSKPKVYFFQSTSGSLRLPRFKECFRTLEERHFIKFLLYCIVLLYSFTWSTQHQTGLCLIIVGPCLLSRLCNLFFNLFNCALDTM